MKRVLRPPLFFVFLVLLLAGNRTAKSGVITVDFNSLAEGTIIDNEYSGQGLTLSATNSDTNTLTLYDSTKTGGQDPDLEGPPNDNWDGGNLAPSTNMGNLLIIADDTVDTSPSDGLIDDPNDDRQGGTIVAEFDFDLYSLDSDGFQEQCCITLYNDGTLVGQVFFDDFTDSGSDFYDSTIAYGDDYANDFQDIWYTDPNENVAGGVSNPGNGTGTIGIFDEVHINLGGSGGFDNFRYVQTPEPGTLAMMGLGLLGLGASARRKRKAARQ